MFKLMERPHSMIQQLRLSWFDLLKILQYEANINAKDLNELSPFKETLTNRDKYVWYKDPNEISSHVASLTIRIYSHGQ